MLLEVVAGAGIRVNGQSAYPGGSGGLGTATIGTIINGQFKKIDI